MHIVESTDPVQSAKEAGLRYYTDAKPGLTRKKSGKGFRYLNAAGEPVRDRATLARIKSLVIPPAWTDVWICPDSMGHLQATGRDAKGRKQSRYHPRWREFRDENKYERMLSFGKALPTIRAAVEEDLSLSGLPRRKVLATILRIMDKTLIRVGNEEYARKNKSYGLTTLRNHHVQVNGSTIVFKFQGKSGVRHTIDLQDRRIASIVRRCQDMPGYELFQYVDSEGEPQAIDSNDVNEYLRETSRQDFTSKDFRTWAGTLLASMALRECEPFDCETQAKKNVVQVIKRVSSRLGNTPSVCRKCYVHPAVLEAYMAGTLTSGAKKALEECDEVEALRIEEASLMRLLQQQQRAAA